MCTQSRYLLFTYNMLRRQLHTSQIQWACLEGFGQTLGLASNAVGANVGMQGSNTISPLEKKCHGPSLCCSVVLSCWAFKFLFKYHWVDNSTYWRAVAKKQHSFENTLRGSWPRFRLLWPPGQWRPASGHFKPVPSMLSLKSLPRVLSYSICCSVGGFICTFINTSIMPRGLAGGAALWI